MDGLLVIDKPVGPTSHDVVARVRRVLDEQRVGHTGTLDPAASGVLPLVVGRATRLARFLSEADKTYEAVIRIGFVTDTYDAEGQVTQPVYLGPFPTRETVDRALDAFRGTFDQTPPAYSAKKIGGRRSYRLARAATAGRSAAASDNGASPPLATAKPISVTVTHIEILEMAAEMVRLRIDCSAGFYMRSLAHDLGLALGVGASLSALRRTRSGDLAVESATPLDVFEAAGPGTALSLFIPLSRMLPALPPLILTPEGVRRVVTGRNLGTHDVVTTFEAARVEATAPLSASGRVWVRLLDSAGHLVGIAEPADADPGFLHPSVVLV